MPDSSLRVCMISPLPPPYGGISHWTEMIRQYSDKREGFDLRIVDTACRWRAIHDLSLWKRGIGGFFQTIEVIFRLCHIILSWRPHTIHLTTAGQFGVFRDLAVLFVARLFHIPVIYHIHFGRVPMIAEARTLEWRLIARAMRRSNTVIAIDSPTKSAVRLHLPDVRIIRVPNCVNIYKLPQSVERSGSGQTVVFIGWVIPTKGVEELIEAWKLLQRDGWRLCVIGPGNPDYIKQLIDKYRPERVDFLGELAHDEAMKQLAGADVFVLPSYTEGFPNVVLEAMSLGKPIVATNVGSIPEMLVDECGIVVKPKDVHELAVALSKVFENEKLRTDMGKRARDRALSTYSLKKVFETYMSVWRQAAELQEYKKHGGISP